MREIMLINPKGKVNMPKKKKTKKSKAAAIVKSGARRAAGRAFGGLSFRAALKDMAPFQIGMLAAKFAAKKGGDIVPVDTDPASWGWPSYLRGALGAVVAAGAANMIKPGWGQKVLVGGLNEVASRIIRNELIEKSAWAKIHFGQDYETEWAYRPDGVGQSEQLYVDTDGTPYLRGAGQTYLPLDEQHRMLPSTPGYYGDTLVRPGPLGDTLVRPGPLGQDPDMRRYAEEYQ
jgi:hypothetical protein